MDYPKFIVSNQKEESISIQRVKFHFQLNVMLATTVLVVTRRPLLRTPCAPLVTTVPLAQIHPPLARQGLSPTHLEIQQKQIVKTVLQASILNF